jgi:hypothetical protein
MTTTRIDPKEHDIKTAAAFIELAKAQVVRERAESRIIYATSPIETLHGEATKRGWGHEEVWHNFEDALRYVEARMMDNGDTRLLEAYEDAMIAVGTLQNEIEEMEAEYTGWSRVFLVTSSAGHIHRSMHCATCFPSTGYGWLPELSGLTEAEAVEAHGPALCSVCFSSAPIEDTGHKITASRAQELVWSPDRDKKIAQREARDQAKAEAKAKKAANKLKRDESLAHKVNTLIDLGLTDHDEYEWTWDHKGFETAHYVHSDMKRKAR